MDWKALYFEAIGALMAMESRAEKAEAEKARSLEHWKIDPEVMLAAVSELYQREKDANLQRFEQHNHRSTKRGEQA